MSHKIPFIVLLLTICTIVGVSFASVGAAVLPARATSSTGSRPMTTYSFTRISTGLNHSCALTSIGTIYCWGLNAAGQLGTGTNTNSSIPVLVKNPVGVTFNAVSANGNHTCAKSTTNQIYCWGNNASGQLGIGSTTNKNLPTAVLAPTGITFVNIYLGHAHTCGLTGTGIAYCWGINDYGNLGIGSNLVRTSPALVTRPTGVSFASISGGQYHTCATTTTNRVYCWGQNIYGRLGDGTTTNRLIPVAATMPTGITFSAVSAGGAFSCANSSAGNAYCWGYNNVGQLGTASVVAQSVPTAVTMPASTTFSQLSAGGQHACATAPDNTAYCWGLNSSGQLGNGTSVNSNIPIASTLPSGILFSSISAGGEHTCAITTTNDAYCWGLNSSGQLGDGTTTNRNAPVLVVMPIMPTSTPTKTATHTRTNTATRTSTVTRSNTRTQTSTMTRSSTRTATSTRSNTFTRTQTHTMTSTVTRTATRTNTNTRTNTPTATSTNTRTATNTATHTATATPVPIVFTKVAVSLLNGCALTSTGGVYCWGTNVEVPGNTLSLAFSSIPVPVTMPTGVTFTAITQGTDHRCALTSLGDAYCWGNQHNRVGDGTSSGPPAIVPQQVTMPSGVTFTSIDADSNHTCAIGSNNTAYCWGTNSDGQLGDGTTTDRYVPVPVTMPSGVTFTKIAAGAMHTCALSSTGMAYCWGDNDELQFGNGTTTDSLTPVAVPMPSGVVYRDISAGTVRTCALSLTNVAYCWGPRYSNASNDIFNTGVAAVTMPSNTTFTTITSGQATDCALAPTGTAFCWGDMFGQGTVGDGTTTLRPNPVAVVMPAGATFTTIHSTGSTVCATSSQGKVYCWGRNNSGQFGNGTTTNSNIPVMATHP